MNTSIAAPIVARFRKAIAEDPRHDRIRARSRKGTPAGTRVATTVGTAAIVFGVLISSGMVLFKILNRAAARTQHKQVDKIRDKTLKDSFPASDPPASQFFDIPVNRR